MTKAVTLFNHIESDIPGDSYRRAKEMRLLNPKGGVKAVEYYQEDYINLLNNQKTTTQAPMLRLELDVGKLGEKISLVNPDTGDIIGEKYLLEIIQTTFVFAHSLYLYAENQEAKKSTTALTPSTPPVVEPVTITPVTDNYVEPVIVDSTPHETTDTTNINTTNDNNTVGNTNG